MNDSASRVTPSDHGISASRREVLGALLDEVDETERAAVASLARSIIGLFHLELHHKLEGLKAAYAREHGQGGDGRADPPSHRLDLAEALTQVLERANYRRLSQEELDHALSERGLLPLSVSIDFGAYEDRLVFVRGETTRTNTVRQLWGLRTRTSQVCSFDRVCLYLRFRAGHPDAAGRGQLTALKLFRDIPKADLEMLFPNTRLRMRGLDKALLGVPAIVGGVPVMIKLLPAFLALAMLVGLIEGEVNEASILAGLSGLVGLVLFAGRQWTKFQSRKLLFMKMLSEHLYFRNTDNDDGVLSRIVDEAGEEESKEVLLAYVMLRSHPGATARELDAAVETWLMLRFGARVDFEIDDALRKLVRLGLVTEEGGRYRALPIEDTRAAVRVRWDELSP